ncbi:proliferation marker protein Ki-67-like [Heptranchias perlo]|uniref:proliferation marker protein Ki-67-like n=1 Tax=Heptranchias perlo TaxID=212740 RepID=UPI003559A2C4
MDHNGGLAWIENVEDKSPSSRSLFGRNPKFDLNTMGPDVDRDHCQLAMYENNEVILKNQNCAAPALLNGKSVSDGNLVKQHDIITVFNDSLRFENQDLENFTSASAKDVATQDLVSQEYPLEARRARRNAPGKRKSRTAPLHEIAISSVENLNRSPKQLSCRQLLKANSRLCLPLTLVERKTFKLHKLVKCRSRTQQMSIHQERLDETSESTEIDMSRTASLELDLTPTDRLPWKPVTQESKGSTVQTVGRDGEGRTSFPAKPGDCATGSKPVYENITNKQEDCLMDVDKELSNAVLLFTEKTPSIPLGSSMGTANQLEVTAEMFSLKSAGKASAERKRFSRRASSVGARGSPETNSLICYIAKQRMQPQESQKVSMLKSKMAAFMGTFQALQQGDRKISTPEFLHLSNSQQIGTTAAQRDCTLSPSCSKMPQKKKVTFGGELSPELFDKRLPSNTPLRKGETPVYQKIVFSDGPPSALKRGSKVQPSLEDQMTSSNNVAHSDSSPVNYHGNDASFKLLRKLVDNRENGAAGTHNVDEERCCPIPINFEILSPMSECTFGSYLQKNYKNDEYPCEALEMKVPELKGGPLDTVSLSELPGKMSEAGVDSVTCGNVMNPKKTDSISQKLKLSRIRTEPDQYLATTNNLKSSKVEASIGESDMQHMSCMLDRMSQPGEKFLDRQITDLSISDTEQASSCMGDVCPSIQNLPDEQREETKDKARCIESLSTKVSPSPITKSKEEVKTGNQEQESMKEEPRRSARIKSNVKNISKNSTTVTKGKCRKKFRKDLYGKREYASRKPLLSPIAEVVDIWSESAGSPDCNVLLGCGPMRRTSLIYLEGNDIGGESRQNLSKSECPADGYGAAYTVTKSVGKKARRAGRLRKSRMCYLEEEQDIQGSAESETQKGTVGNVPKKSSKKLSYCLMGSSDQSSNASYENTEDRVCEVEALKSSSGENVANDHDKPTVKRRKSSIKIERKHLSEEFAVVRSSQQGITGVKILFEGQCATGTGLEEHIKKGIQTGDCNCLSSFLDSESNVLEDINKKQLQTEPDEMEELTPFSNYTAFKESQVISNEPLRADAAVPEEKEVCISPPDIREVFRSRPSRRKSKFFSVTELAYEKQPEQAAVLKVGGQHMVDTSSENGEKGENVTQRERNEERFLYDMIVKPIFPSHENGVDEVGGAQVTTNDETLLDNFGHHCSLEQINTNIFAAADQLETRIKNSASSLEQSILKKVRRSARLTHILNMEGLSWIEITSPEQLEEKKKRCRLTRRSFTESGGKLSSAEEVESKAASQTRIRILRRRSLSCNRNIVIDELEEPPQKNFLLD